MMESVVVFKVCLFLLGISVLKVITIPCANYPDGNNVQLMLAIANLFKCELHQVLQVGEGGRHDFEECLFACFIW